MEAIKIVFNNTAKKILLPENYSQLVEAFNNLIPNQISIQNNFVLYYINNENAKTYINNDNNYQNIRNNILENHLKLVKIGLEIIPNLLQKEEFKDELNYLKSFIDNKFKLLKENITEIVNKNIENQINICKTVYNSKINIEHNIPCNECKNYKIKGIRYKCSQCSEYNLCELCEKDNKHEQEYNHIFIKIRKPEQFNELKTFFSQIKINDNNKNINPTNVANNNNNQDINYYPSVIPNKEELSSKLVTPNKEIEIEISYKKGDEFHKNIKLLNDGKVAWPKNVLLSCLDSLSEIKGKNIPIRIKLNPLNEINVSVTFDKDKEVGVYKSYWQLVTEKGQHFGEIIIFKVTILPNEEANKPNTLFNIDKFHKYYKNNFQNNFNPNDRYNKNKQMILDYRQEKEEDDYENLLTDYK